MDAPIRREEVDFNQEDYLNRMDFGLHAGFVIGWQVGKGVLQAEFRYFKGFKDASSRSKSLNHSIHWGIGYNYEL